MDFLSPTYGAKSFIIERDRSSIAYEVKRTRAVWDDGLVIPGTNRRGGCNYRHRRHAQIL